jgi:threonine synthase
VLELVLVNGKPERESLLRQDLPLGVWRYGGGLPLDENAELVTLNEGGTPLVHSAIIGGEMKLSEVYFKNEGQNPTGSFKDRGMTVAVSSAKRNGAKFLLCASTGNTSASLAAYAARGKMKSVVLVPSGKVAAGKLVQATVYGAKIMKVKGDFDRALQLALRLANKNREFYLMNSLNPYRVEGQKTAAYEIYEQLGRKVPDYLVLPVGNAGNISAYWKGFSELKLWGISDKVPRMVGVQATGAAPMARMIEEGSEKILPWDSPNTIASAIRIGNPVSWRKAYRAIKESRGTAFAVSDEEILQARDELALKEGLFVEAASAAPAAALRRLKRMVDPDSSIVCIATGNGLKDQESVRVVQEGVPEFSGEDELLNAIGE